MQVHSTSPHGKAGLFKLQTSNFKLRNNRHIDTPKVSSVSERGLIERIRQRAGAAPDWITLGIGDDAAVVRPERGTFDVLTTDALIEGVHFRRDWSAAHAIGHKALAVNLSDLAAMGARPRAVLLSLALPADLDLAAFDDLIDAFVTLGKQTGAPLVGGNITRSPGPLIVDVTAVGSAHPRRLLTRSGGRPGDELWLSGTVGGAGAGLAMLREGIDRRRMSDAAQDCLARYETPTPRVALGRRVAGSRAASACVDLSDGLADAARQLAAASRTGVVIEADAVPVHDGAAAWAIAHAESPAEFAMRAGEDYELLFAVPQRRIAGFTRGSRSRPDAPVTRVGRLTAEPGYWVKRDGRLEPLPEGFGHF